MVLEVHRVWATEWTFFCLEVVSGYLFYRYGPRLPDPTRLRLLGLSAFASWMSLFWINGILSWQLTPGGWLENRDVWTGFFNPGFLPSLLFRTISAAAIAALAWPCCGHGAARRTIRIRCATPPPTPPGWICRTRG